MTTTPHDEGLIDLTQPSADLGIRIIIEASTDPAERQRVAPEDLYRHRRVLHRPTGKAFDVLGGDTRYSVTGEGVGEYRADPSGEGVLLRSAVHTHPWGWVSPLSDLAALPGGEGMYHPDHLATAAATLEATLDGSFRVAALAGNAEWDAVALSGDPAFPYPAIWTRPTSTALVIGGTGVNGRAPVRVDVQPVTVLGPVNFEPGMVRVRTLDSQVHRALRENITATPDDRPYAVTATIRVCDVGGEALNPNGKVWLLRSERGWQASCAAHCGQTEPDRVRPAPCDGYSRAIEELAERVAAAGDDAAMVPGDRDPVTVVDRRAGFIPDGTRYFLSNGWFIDGNHRTTARPVREHRYSVWEPGGDPSGCAALRGTESNLERLLDKVNGMFTPAPSVEAGHDEPDPWGAVLAEMRTA